MNKIEKTVVEGLSMSIEEYALICEFLNAGEEYFKDVTPYATPTIDELREFISYQCIIKE